ncbi:MAG: glycosyltransferase family 39 protein, partial [bacterium]|nr:glycosyltransferase family 39 protein [bacterium]
MSSKAPSSIVQSSFFSRHKKTLKHLGILWLAFFVLVAVMLPFREAGFQDDYEYHHAVRNLLNTGVFKNSEITIVTFIFQGYWGALFSHLFGFSYTTLQAATLTLFFFGISAFYLTLLELFSDRKKALFFSLFLLFSPPLLRYAFSFMTDIPYLSLFLLSIYFAVMTMRTGSLRYAILTGSIGACSFFTRNLGIF